MDAGRRGFLRGRFLTRQGREAMARERLPLGPYPPCHGGRLEPAVCAACGHPCVAACEAAILRLHEGDHTLAGVPYLDVSKTGCSFCGACAEACPEARLPVLPLPGALGVARLDPGRCLAINGVVCLACSQACDARAIALDARQRPRVTAGCTGCGACVGSCPTRALSVIPAAGAAARRSLPVQG